MQYIHIIKLSPSFKMLTLWNGYEEHSAVVGASQKDVAIHGYYTSIYCVHY